MFHHPAEYSVCFYTEEGWPPSGLQYDLKNKVLVTNMTIFIFKGMQPKLQGFLLFKYLCITFTTITFIWYNFEFILVTISKSVKFLHCFFSINPKIAFIKKQQLKTINFCLRKIAYLIPFWSEKEFKDTLVNLNMPFFTICPFTNMFELFLEELTLMFFK